MRPWLKGSNPMAMRGIRPKFPIATEKQPATRQNTRIDTPHSTPQTEIAGKTRRVVGFSAAC